MNVLITQPQLRGVDLAQLSDKALGGIIAGVYLDWRSFDRGRTYLKWQHAFALDVDQLRTETIRRWGVDITQ